MKLDGFKQNLKQIATAKSSKKIEEFGETYSSILLGMHSDINQYKRQVDKTQNLVNSVDQKLETGLQNVEETYRQIQNDKLEIIDRERQIQQVHVAMISLHESFAMTAAEVGAFKTQIGTMEESFHNQQQTLNITRAAITGLKETLVKKEEEIKLYKTIVLIVSVVVMFILFFAIWRF